MDGKIVSTPFISAENLPNIRPIGVISKKNIGSRKVLSRRYLCIFEAAVTVAIVYIILEVIIVKAKTKTKQIY